MTTTALRALLGSMIALAVLAGCANAPVTGPGAVPPDPAAPSPSPAPAVVVPDAATAARIDADYARMMIPHHDQALLLSSLATGRSASPDVATLAFRIDREQVEEAGQLRGFLRLRGEPADGARTTGMDGMAEMAGMADAATIARLRAARGPAFDRLWLDTMIAHHEGALAMARDHLADTGGTGVRGSGSVSALAEFSRTTLRTQQAEIDRMRALTRS